MEREGPKSLKDVQIGDVLPTSVRGGCCCVSYCVVIFILVVLFFPATMIQLGVNKVGLLRNKRTGRVDLNTVYTPGQHWIGFWQEFIEYPSTLCTIDFVQWTANSTSSGSLVMPPFMARDQAGYPFYIEFSVQYKIPPENVGKLYAEYQTRYQGVFVSELRDGMLKVMNSIGVRSAWQDFEGLQSRMKAACDAAMKHVLVVCWDLQLFGVSLTADVETLLTTEQVQKQAAKTAQAQKNASAVRARTQVMLAELRRNITVAQASGQANVSLIGRQAVAQAQENLNLAMASMLETTRSVVALPSPNASGTNCMDNSQVERYQKYTMYQSQTDRQWIYDASTGVTYTLPAQEVQAITQLQADNDFDEMEQVDEGIITSTKSLDGLWDVYFEYGNNYQIEVKDGKFTDPASITYTLQIQNGIASFQWSDYTLQTSEQITDTQVIWITNATDVAFKKVLWIEVVTSGIITTTPKVPYAAYPLTRLDGYAAGDQTARNAEDSEARCNNLGWKCTGYTCNDGRLLICTVRSGTELLTSDGDEFTFFKELPPTTSTTLPRTTTAVGTPVAATAMPMVSQAKVIGSRLNGNWIAQYQDGSTTKLVVQNGVIIIGGSRYARYTISFTDSAISFKWPSGSVTQTLVTYTPGRVEWKTDSPNPMYKWVFWVTDNSHGFSSKPGIMVAVVAVALTWWSASASWC